MLMSQQRQRRSSSRSRVHRDSEMRRRSTSRNASEQLRQNSRQARRTSRTSTHNLNSLLFSSEDSSSHEAVHSSKNPLLSEVKQLKMFMQSEHRYKEKLRRYSSVERKINRQMSSEASGGFRSKATQQAHSEFQAVRSNLKDSHLQKMSGLKGSTSLVALQKAIQRARYTARAIESESLMRKADMISAWARTL